MRRRRAGGEGGRRARPRRPRHRARLPDRHGADRAASAASLLGERLRRRLRRVAGRRRTSVVGFVHGAEKRLLVSEPLVELGGLIVAAAARRRGAAAALIAAVEALDAGARRRPAAGARPRGARRRRPGLPAAASRSKRSSASSSSRLAVARREGRESRRRARRRHGVHSSPHAPTTARQPSDAPDSISRGSPATFSPMTPSNRTGPHRSPRAEPARPRGRGGGRPRGVSQDRRKVSGHGLHDGLQPARQPRRRRRRVAGGVPAAAPEARAGFAAIPRSRPGSSVWR